jgi:hypothetical protein
VVWPTPDPLFLVPVGIDFGRLRMSLLHKQGMISGLMAIVVFVMPSAGILIENCSFLRSVEAFPFANELLTHSLAQEKLSKVFAMDTAHICKASCGYVCGVVRSFLERGIIVPSCLKCNVLGTGDNLCLYYLFIFPSLEKQNLYTRFWMVSRKKCYSNPAFLIIAITSSIEYGGVFL